MNVIGRSDPAQLGLDVALNGIQVVANKIGSNTLGAADLGGYDVAGIWEGGAFRLV